MKKVRVLWQEALQEACVWRGGGLPTFSEKAIYLNLKII